MKRCLCVVSVMLPFFFNCADSPLSDVEIDDFGLIAGTFTVDKNNGMDVKVTAAIRDKNSYGVYVKNGSVTVNGAEMNYDNTSKTYEKNNLPVVKNSLYTFVVTLPNGDTCMSAIRTPKAEFGVVTCPDTFHILRNVTVSWSDFAGSGTYLDYLLQVNSDADTNPLYSVVAQGSIVDTGSLVFSSGMFDPAKDTGPGFLILIKQTTGTTSLLLRSGSNISSAFKWQRSCILAK